MRPTQPIRPRRRARLGLILTVVVAMAMAVAACGGVADPHQSGGKALQVVATTTVFADIVRSVGGDRVSVTSIIPAGVGPEDYEPKPDAAKQLAGADLIVSNGVGLDDFLDKLLQASGEAQAARLVLGDGIPAIIVDGEANPHFWLDPSLVAAHYVPAIAAALTRLDPSGSATYAANAAAYTTQLQALDDANKAALAQIPPANRKLVTFHDAFPYFAAHYGFELIGVILPNVGQEPSASQLAGLVDTVRASGAKAVFAEAQFNPQLARTLAQEAGVSNVVTTLYNDTVGPPPDDTYLKMMAWNVDQIVRSLR